jgi:hypothetical protein
MREDIGAGRSPRDGSYRYLIHRGSPVVCFRGSIPSVMMITECRLDSTEFDPFVRTIHSVIIITLGIFQSPTLPLQAPRRSW